MIWVGVERVVEGKGGCGMRVEVEESEGVISRFVDSDYKCGTLGMEVETDGGADALDVDF